MKCLHIIPLTRFFCLVRTSFNLIWFIGYEPMQSLITPKLELDPSRDMSLESFPSHVIPGPTVDGVNPAPPGMYRTCKQWDKLPIKW